MRFAPACRQAGAKRKQEGKKVPPPGLPSVAHH
jgi:hypothetical protein